MQLQSSREAKSPSPESLRSPTASKQSCALASAPSRAPTLLERCWGDQCSEDLKMTCSFTMWNHSTFRICSLRSGPWLIGSVVSFGRFCMMECDSSSKVPKSVLKKRRNVPRCWREHFASLAMRSLSPPSTNLPPSLLSKSQERIFDGVQWECFANYIHLPLDLPLYFCRERPQHC